MLESNGVTRRVRLALRRQLLTTMEGSIRYFCGMKTELFEARIKYKASIALDIPGHTLRFVNIAKAITTAVQNTNNDDGCGECHLTFCGCSIETVSLRGGWLEEIIRSDSAHFFIIILYNRLE